MKIDDKSRVKDLYMHPVGRDVIDKIFLQMDRSVRWVTNPAVAQLRLGTLKRLTAKRLGADFWESVYWLLNSHPDRPSDGNPDPSDSWWKEAVFYQIYPRSFMDSNGDGIGDLNGIISKLDYLQTLGVDALWLSPIYDSPNDDNGYDIRDYRKIMDEMGTLDDFDRLLADVHARGMRLIMDLVVNHTSDEHAWFRQALEDPEGPYSQYYFFREGSPEIPPNNWVSFFSGPAWRRFPEQERWALRLFSAKQMDLNWDHAAVRGEVADLVRWWLDRGVDGFRLDVINYISKREGLPNGNAAIGELMTFYGIENFFYGPRLHEYLRELRTEAFDPYSAFSVGETPGIGLEMGRLLAGQDRRELDLVFNFDHLETPGKVRYDHYRYNLNYLKDYYIKYQTRLTSNEWMSIFWENHDNPRMISKVEPNNRYRDRLGKLLLTLQLTLRGTPFLYQGQELGEINQPFKSIRQLRDVEALNRYHEIKETQGSRRAWRQVIAGTRDHARVPMHWQEGLHGGFTSGRPWIERPVDDRGWSAAEQEAQDDSVLWFARRMLALRRQYRPLRKGTLTFFQSWRPHYLAYHRDYDGIRLFIEINLSDRPLLKRPVNDKLLISNIRKSSSRSVMEPYEASVYLCRQRRS